MALATLPFYAKNIPLKFNAFVLSLQEQCSLKFDTGRNRLMLDMDNKMAEPLSYTEQKNKEKKLRRIFYPDIFTFCIESIIAIIALVLFNVSDLSARLLYDGPGKNDPFAYTFGLVGNFFDVVQKYYVVQQISLFLLWAIAGSLVYILLFRLLQIIFGVGYSFNEAFSLYKQENGKGVMRWLGSLHDFFIKTFLIICGVLAFSIAFFVCFGLASQELKAGLIYGFPSNLTAIFLSILGAIISVRLIIIGLSLLSTRFLYWYTISA
jgi:hypothetical protein